MPTKTVSADVDVEIEMDDFTNDEVREEYLNRFGISTVTLEQIYEEFARRGDAPPVQRNYLYETIGRILP
jgi:hypothetical protein